MKSCIASDPTEDTESSAAPAGAAGRKHRCIASDPTEDTERAGRRGAQGLAEMVASPPIRPRILKVPAISWAINGARCCIASDPTEDTERTVQSHSRTGAGRSCIASDPTEDTERRKNIVGNRCGEPVASPPIRPRILKVWVILFLGFYGDCCIASDPTEDTERPPEESANQADESCIASDPTEDTERGIPRPAGCLARMLHRLRSDRGY